MTVPSDPDRNPTEAEMPTFLRSELGVADLTMMARISAMLLKIVLLQKRVPVSKLVATFDVPESDRSSNGVDIGRVNWLTRGVLRRMFSGRYCMKRSLILFHFLRKANHDARIVFGVTKEDGKLEGHAWVTVNGRPYAEEGPVDRYVVTYAYPE